MNKFLKGFLIGYLGVWGKRVASNQADKSHKNLLAKKPVRKKWGG